MSSTHRHNYNLSEPHKELIQWHNRLGHIGLRTIQFLMRSRALATSQLKQQLHTRAAKITVHDLPKCPACQFGQQTNRPVPGSKQVVNTQRQGITSADRLYPGQLMFLDHFHSTAQGRKNSGHGVSVNSRVDRKSYGG